MDSEPRFLDLAGGQRLALAEYGARDGEPVFFCHGWPGARQQAERLGAAGGEFGFRLISFDRPGIARSSLPAHRTLADWPLLLAEAADRLGVEKFRIAGVSGGGPYALISAWALPDRVLAAATICGAPEIAAMHDRSLLLPAYRALLAMNHRSPTAVRWLFRGLRPFVRMPLPRGLRPLVLKAVGDADARTLADPALFDLCYEAFREAWLGSADGVFADAQIYAKQWGFSPEEIKVPVFIWHGRDDTNFHWSLAEDLGRRIPGSRVTIVEDEGHYSLPFNAARAILSALK